VHPTPNSSFRWSSPILSRPLLSHPLLSSPCPSPPFPPPPPLFSRHSSPLFFPRGPASPCAPRSAAEIAVTPPECPRSSSARPSRRLAWVRPTTSLAHSSRISHLAHSCRIAPRSLTPQAPREGVVVLTKASADDTSAYNIPRPTPHTPHPTCHTPFPPSQSHIPLPIEWPVPVLTPEIGVQPRHDWVVQTCPRREGFGQDGLCEPARSEPQGESGGAVHVYHYSRANWLSSLPGRILVLPHSKANPMLVLGYLHTLDIWTLSHRHRPPLPPVLATRRRPTLCLCQPANARPQHIFESVQASLKRLQLDYIDLLQCHRCVVRPRLVQPNTPPPFERLCYAPTHFRPC
jgi:hypothetical protein